MQRVDARFLLPRRVRRAAVLGGLEEWAGGLAEAGVEVERGDRSARAAPDVAVAPASLVASALATGAAAVVLEGRVRDGLAGDGLSVRRFVPVGGLEKPRLFLPLGNARLSRYALGSVLAATSRRKRLRNAVLQRLVARDVPPPGPLVTVVTREPPQPFVLGAAEPLGLGRDSEWLLATGRQASNRNVLHVFPSGAERPRWVVRFGRFEGAFESIEREERGLRLAAAAGPAVAASAPALVGRFDADGISALAETAALGRRLDLVLEGPGARSTKLALIEAVAGWLVDVARATAASPEALAEHRAWLAGEIVPHWVAHGAPADLVVKVGPVPGVLEHRDLWPSNVVVGGGSFTAIDWEGARRHGLPLSDLLYFLRASLAALDGALGDEASQLDYFARLFRGEEASSAVVFEWVRKMVGTLSLPREAVGPIATLCWLDYGFAFWDVPEPALAPALETRFKTRLAHRWLADPALGPGWVAWT